MRFLLGLMLPLSLLAAPAQAETRECPGAEVVVVYEDRADFVMVCNAAAKTIGFFRQTGFLAETPMMIAVKKEVRFEQGLSGEAYGICDPGLGYIEVLSYDSHKRLQADEQIFGLRLNPALHESIIVHEVAHALANSYFSVTDIPVAVHEYIAYVAQLATLPEVVRRNVLRRHSDTALADEAAINALNYATEPQIFGVRAYRHFVQQGDLNVHLLRLFAGDSAAYHDKWLDI